MTNSLSTVALPTALALPTVLVPGLLCSPRVYAEQMPSLWRSGPVFVADHTRDTSMADIAKRILAAAPPRFALAGISMGGYISFEIMRQAPARVVKLALLDTTARPDLPEQSERRRALMALAERAFEQIPDLMLPTLVHRSRKNDPGLRNIVHAMAEETGPQAFLRQQTAIIDRIDSRPTLASIRCPTLVLVGDGDELITPDKSAEIAAGIAGSRLVTIANAGHLSTIEQPQAVTQALMEWLAP
jgi:pimeloyl-ACP methyl ester carboxylesterase